MTSLTLAPNDLAILYTPNGTHLETPDIQDYLALMLAKYDEGDEQCLFLPSLMSMSECFQCSAVEVHHALTELKERGCDTFIMGFESPITLWYPDRLGRAQAS
ncbi:hypothetical protein [Vampirovibrio sp.]|uniref:hypothetical protein n=1 Tax=Vampirovibrio sp. TaxID=2717857 RepID=UPI00359313DB